MVKKQKEKPSDEKETMADVLDRERRERLVENVWPGDMAEVPQGSKKANIDKSNEFRKKKHI